MALEQPDIFQLSGVQLAQCKEWRYKCFSIVMHMSTGDTRALQSQHQTLVFIITTGGAYWCLIQISICGSRYSLSVKSLKTCLALHQDIEHMRILNFLYKIWSPDAGQSRFRELYRQQWSSVRIGRKGKAANSLWDCLRIIFKKLICRLCFLLQGTHHKQWFFFLWWFS